MAIAWIWAKVERMLLQEAMFKEVLCTDSEARLFYLLSLFKVTGPFIFSHKLKTCDEEVPHHWEFSFFKIFIMEIVQRIYIPHGFFSEISTHYFLDGVLK